MDELDSASIISLLDSMIKLDESYSPALSQLAFRVGYNSQVLNAGRDLGLNQFGLSLGAAYYHKSGLYADFTGYSNSQNDPEYYLNLMSLGYMKELGKKWAVVFSYDHYFYNSTEEDAFNELYTDGLNATVYSLGQLIDTGLDYSAIFGDTTTAHRITWFVNGNIKLKKLWFFDKVNIMPSASMLFGNGTSYLFNVTLSERQRAEVDRQRRLVVETDELNTFGLLNYSLSLPVSFRIGNFGFLASYQYNIPVELPGQDENLENNSFISLSAHYFIQL